MAFETINAICRGDRGEELRSRYEKAGHCNDAALPPLTEQAKSYAASTAKHALNGFKKTSEEEQVRRMSICNLCTWLRKEDGKCAKCGCPVSAKVQRPLDQCPLGKWQKTEHKWAIGVTVVNRNPPTIGRCLKSMENAGFEKGAITVFADVDAQGNPVELDEYSKSHRVVQSRNRLGCWRNFQNALFNVSHNFGKDADLVMIVQDDAEFARDVAAAVSDRLWPSARTGVLLLGTVGFYREDPMRLPIRHRGTWIQVRDDNLAGAIAMVFPGDVARAMSEQANVQDWLLAKGGNLESLKHVDIWTGHAVRKLKKECWAHIPSLVDHIQHQGDQVVNSTIGHDGPFGKRSMVDFIGKDESAIGKIDTPKRFSVTSGLAIEELIGVVIPVAGHCPDLISQCLGALKRNADVSTQIVIVDNDSSEETKKEIKRWVTKELEMAEVITNEENKGFTEAVNQGMAKLPMMDVLLLNSDTQVAPGCIREMLRILRTTDRCASVGPITCDDGFQSLKNPLRLAQSGLPAIPGDPEDTAPWIERMTSRSSSEEIMVAWFCAILSGDAIQKVGYPNGHHSGLGVDDQWCSRARSMGYTVRVAHGAYCYHRHMETFKRLGLDRNALQAQARNDLK